MAALMEVGDPHEHVGDHQYNDGAMVHASEGDEGLMRSYVCSMSSVIDLECPVDGNNADLALNMQRYLSRIVEELHLISAWSSSIYLHQRTAAIPTSTEGNPDYSFTAMARLAVVTDIELMRRDMTKALHELFQRCSTQIAYVQSEANAAIIKQETLYHELMQCMDDQQRAWDQQTQSIQALKKKYRAESDAQIRAMSSTLRQVQQQTSTHSARISALEKSLAAVTTAQSSYEQELQTLQRRVESFENVHQLQVGATHRAAEDSMTKLRASHSQLSAKIQVLRLEMQELSDSTQKRMQQLLKIVSSVPPSAPGRPQVMPTPRRPSVTTPRTPRSPQTPGPGASSDSLDDSTVADAVETTDCFIYAKAALPHRNSTNSTTKKPVAPSTGSSRVVTSSSEVNLSSEKKIQSSMTNLLTVQQSVMSLPLGYEEATRPTTATESLKDGSNSADRPDPLIPMRRSTHRHSSLPDTNLNEMQRPRSASKFQTSRLHTKR